MHLIRLKYLPFRCLREKRQKLLRQIKNKYVIDSEAEKSDGFTGI